MFGANGSLLVKKHKARSNNLHWTLKENLLYKRFLQQNIDLFESNDPDQKNNKVNVQMS